MTSVVKVPMTVVIPTGQYANIQPQVEGVGATFEEAQADALRKAASFYDNIEAQASLTLKLPAPVVAPVATAVVTPSVKQELLADWFDGTKVLYDDAAHKYVDDASVSYLSGSSFAHDYEPEFKKELIIPSYAKKHGMHEVEVEEYWAAKAKSSTDWGTAVHQALETYGRYWRTNLNIGKDEFDGIPMYLRPLVAKFYTEDRKTQDAVHEMFTADAGTHRCGRMDRVVIVDRANKILDIEDYKTNKEMFTVDQYKKNLLTPFNTLPNMNAAKYTLQLSFYKGIVESKGWSVRNLTLHWLTPQFDWQSIKLRPVDTNV